jgi:hypothetical protein
MGSSGSTPTAPTYNPSAFPSYQPTLKPSCLPTVIPTYSPTLRPTSSGVYQIGVKFYSNSLCSTLLTSSYNLNGVCSTISTCASSGTCYSQSFQFQCLGSSGSYSLVASYCSTSTVHAYTISGKNITGSTGTCRTVAASTNTYYFTTECKLLNKMLLTQ